MPDTVIPIPIQTIVMAQKRRRPSAGSEPSALRPFATCRDTVGVSPRGARGTTTEAHCPGRVTTRQDLLQGREVGAHGVFRSAVPVSVIDSMAPRAS